jgi:ribosomal-protein-alanine N-acetyltransferase
LQLVTLLPDEIRALIGNDVALAQRSARVVFPPGWPTEQAVRDGLPWHLFHLVDDLRQGAWRIRVMVERSSRGVVGAINLKGPPAARREVEIGWGVEQDRRRQGYAYEAAEAVMGWAFRQPRVPVIVATVPDDNLPSQRVAAKLGMSRTQVMRRGMRLWRKEQPSRL